MLPLQRQVHRISTTLFPSLKMLLPIVEHSNAYVMLSNIDPQTVHLTQCLLRSHILSALNNQSFQAFPHQVSKRQYQRQYKQLQRSNQEFSTTENENCNINRRMKHSNEAYKTDENEKDTQSKNTRRQNDAYRQKEKDQRNKTRPLNRAKIRLIKIKKISKAKMHVDKLMPIYKKKRISATKQDD